MPTLSYTSVDRMLDVQPMLRDVSNLTSIHLFQFASDAEAEVNAALAKLYTVPVPGTPPMLTAIANDLAMYRVLTQRIFNAERLKDSVWPQVFKEARQMLADLASGKTTLVASGGVVISTNDSGAQVASNTMDYNPTFTELPNVEHDIDNDKIDDLRDARE